MKYFGEPKSSVIDYERLKPMFVFDKNGEYETQDPKLIEWMRKNKNFIRHEESTTKETAKGDIICKKCGQTFESMGKLLSHHKQEHKKEGK